jgi:hypothetical protein
VFAFFLCVCFSLYWCDLMIWFRIAVCGFTCSVRVSVVLLSVGGGDLVAGT